MCFSENIFEGVSLWMLLLFPRYPWGTDSAAMTKTGLKERLKDLGMMILIKIGHTFFFSTVHYKRINHVRLFELIIASDTHGNFEKLRLSHLMVSSREKVWWFLYFPFMVLFAGCWVGPRPAGWHRGERGHPRCHPWRQRRGCPDCHLCCHLRSYCVRILSLPFSLVW